MSRIEQVAKEISMIAPRWMRLMRTGTVLPPTLTTSQLAVLMAIYEQGQTTSSKISKVMHVSAPTITGIVDRLVRAKYLRRIPSEKDRRMIYIQLTKKAQTEIQSFFIRIRKRWKSILIVLDVKEAENLLAVLKKILKVAEEKNV